MDFVRGFWNMTVTFPNILGIIIVPIDELIFFRVVGIPTTRMDIDGGCCEESLDILINSRIFINIDQFMDIFPHWNHGEGKSSPFMVEEFR